MVEDLFLASNLSYCMEGRFPRRDCLQSLRTVRELAYFDRHDPLPLVASWVEDACKGAALLASRGMRHSRARHSSRVLSTTPN
jgi:hypothetical protein